MMFGHHVGRRTATIVRQMPGGYDQYGDPVPGTDTRIDVPGCSWAPRAAGSGPSSSEIDERGRQGVIVGLTVYMPSETFLLATDRLELDGLLYEVEGEPGVWGPNPFTGREPGLEVAARRAEG